MAANPISTATVTSFSTVKRQQLDVQLKQLEFHALLHRKLDLVHLFESFLIGGQIFLPFDGLEFVASERGCDVLVGDQRQHRLRYDLVLGGEHLGQIALLRSSSFDTREARVAARLVESVRYPLENALEHHTVLMKSLTDSDSGLYNAKALELDLPREMRTARRAEQPLTMMVIAVDYIESITEHHGMSIANAALSSIAAALGGQLRRGDRLYQVENDEFIALLNVTDTSDALVVAQRLQNTVALSVEDENVSCVLTASCGITDFDSNDDSERFIKRARKGLSKARRHGRNQIKVVPAEYPIGTGFDPSVA